MIDPNGIAHIQLTVRDVARRRQPAGSTAGALDASGRLIPPPLLHCRRYAKLLR